MVKGKGVTKVKTPVTKPLIAVSENTDELRLKHPRVTDFQASVIEHVLRTGDGPVKTAEALGSYNPTISKILRLPHVMAYSKELALATLGTVGLQALARSVNLLNSRSDRVAADVAMDLMNRAGIGVDTAASAPQLGVQINFAPTPEGGPIDVTKNGHGGKNGSN